VTKRVHFLRWTFVLFAIGLLELLCRAGVIAPQVVVAPSIMALTLINLITSGAITNDFITTVGNASIAIVISIFFGILTGLFLWRAKRVRRVIEPVLASYYSVPVFALYPILIALFGMNAMPIIMIGVLFAIVSVVVNSMNGFDRIPRVYLKAARIYGLSGLRTTLSVRLPAALPQMMTGFKLAVAYSFIGVIAAEFILATQGLGYAIAYAYNNFETRTMYALMLLILLLVSTVNGLLMRAEKTLLARRGIA
jgi:NitT/TauT family transport system permease protein